MGPKSPRPPPHPPPSRTLSASKAVVLTATRHTSVVIKTFSSHLRFLKTIDVEKRPERESEREGEKKRGFEMERRGEEREGELNLFINLYQHLHLFLCHSISFLLSAPHTKCPPKKPGAPSASCTSRPVFSCSRSVGEAPREGGRGGGERDGDE